MKNYHYLIIGSIVGGALSIYFIGGSVYTAIPVIGAFLYGVHLWEKSRKKAKLERQA